MAAPKIRSEYEPLGQIGRQSGQEAGNMRQMIEAIRQNLNTLRGGDWVGPGAVAFYSEMDASVMPSVQRVAGAMDAARQASSQICGLRAQLGTNPLTYDSVQTAGAAAFDKAQIEGNIAP